MEQSTNKESPRGPVHVSEKRAHHGPINASKWRPKTKDGLYRYTVHTIGFCTPLTSANHDGIKSSGVISESDG